MGFLIDAVAHRVCSDVERTQRCVTTDDYLAEQIVQTYKTTTGFMQVCR
jgi:hypothetical protein